MKHPAKAKAYSQTVKFEHAELETGARYYLLELSCGHSARYPRCRKYPQVPPKRLRCLACRRERQGLAAQVAQPSDRG